MQEMHTTSAPYKQILRLFLGIIIFYVQILGEIYEFLWRVTVFLSFVEYTLKFWNMTLYTIYESGGEIYELTDAGGIGGSIGVSSHFEVFRSINLKMKFEI